MKEPISAERILRLADVRGRTGLSTSTIYSWITDGRFPKSVSLGARSVGWLESEISGWIESRTTSVRSKK